MKPWQMMRQFGQPASGGGDPYWANVVSLLNFPGADGSTTFTDETGKTWTAAGNAQIDTSLGYQTGQFDGADDVIYTADSADFDFSTGDLTVEAVVNLTSAADATVCTHYQNGAYGGGATSTGGIFFGTNASGQLKLSRAGVADVLFGALAVPTGTPTHIAWSRVSGTSRLFMGGTLEGSAADALDYTASATPNLYVGAYPSLGSIVGELNGRILAFRITKGVGRYTSNFTPPTAPFEL